MDVGTALTIFGAIGTAIGLADLAYKYGSTLFKKINRRARDRKNDAAQKKYFANLIEKYREVISAICSPTLTLKKI